MRDIRKQQTFHNRRFFFKKYLSFINRTITFQMVWLLISRYLKKHLFYLSVQHQDSIIELQSGKITQLQSELEEMKKSCVKDESSVTQQGNCPSSRQLSRHLIHPICSHCGNLSSCIHFAN